MYLNVILTIFVIVQVVTMILMYKWWNKYGRKLFTTFTDMKSKIPTQMFNSVASNNVKGPNLFGDIPDMAAMMKQFENMSKKMGKK
jgi:hypothetical protein